MTLPKRNLERRESTVREFRTLTSGHPNKNVGYNLSGISQQSDEFNRLLENNELEMKKKLQAALYIKQIEATGVYSREAIEDEKVKMGINVVDKSSMGGASATTNEVINMLMMQIANEPDLTRQQDLTKTLATLQMMSEMKNSGGQGTNPAMMMMMNSMNKQSTPTKSTFEEEMTKMMMKKFMEEPKSELDNLGKLKTLMDGVQSLIPQSNPLEELLASRKVMEELGMIKTGSDTLAEKQFELEKMKVEKQFSLDEKKILGEEERNKGLVGVAGDILSSLTTAVSGMGGSDAKPPPNPKDKTIQNSLQANCAKEGCDATITVSNADQSRDVQCVKCKTKYQYKADETKLYMYQDPPKKE